MIVVSDVYEFVDHSNKVDENVLVVDFHFDSDVTKLQAIKIVDRLIHTGMITSKVSSSSIKHNPVIFATSKWKENDDK